MCVSILWFTPSVKERKKETYKQTDRQMGDAKCKFKQQTRKYNSIENLFLVG